MKLLRVLVILFFACLVACVVALFQLVTSPEPQYLFLALAALSAVILLGGIIRLMTAGRKLG